MLSAEFCFHLIDGSGCTKGNGSWCCHRFFLLLLLLFWILNMPQFVTIYIYINHSAPPGICCYNMPSGVQKDRTKTLKNASLKGEATQKKLTIGNIQRCWRLEEFNWQSQQQKASLKSVYHPDLKISRINGKLRGLEKFIFCFQNAHIKSML